MTIKQYLNARDAYWGERPDQVKKEALSKIVEYNKALIREYPFLLPRNRFTYEVPRNYDYSYTELDDLPRGWRINFGEDICREIKDELVKYDALDSYRITQIKEKFGSLRWYDTGTPIGKLSKTFREVTTKFSELPPKVNDAEYLELYESENFTSREEAGSFEEYLRVNEKCIKHWRIYTIEEKCRMPDIIWHYECLSEDICIECGARLEKTAAGSELSIPLCSVCKKELSEQRGGGGNDRQPLLYTLLLQIAAKSLA